MFNNLTYKKKLRLTGIAGLLAFGVIYRLAISRTLEEKVKYEQQLGTDQRWKDGEAASLQTMLAREAHVDTLFARYALDTLLPEKNLLAATSNFCKSNGLQLKEYKPYPAAAEDSIPLLTRTVTVQGSFVPCLRLMYFLETGQKVGRLASAEFRSHVDPQDKQTKLECVMYIQNLTFIHHEDQ